MFEFLKSTLGTQQERPAAEAHAVDDKSHIVSLLMQAYQTHVLFNVKFPGLKIVFSSALIGIYDEHGFIVLDELTPEEGNRLLKIRHRITLDGRLNGVALSFNTELLEAREKNGIAFYKVRLPESIHYQQQRKDPRVPSHNFGIPFHALRGKGTRQIVRGYVNDLSRKGLGVILMEDDVHLYLGEILPSCIITLPDEGEVAFSMEVRFNSKSRKQEITRVGGCFRDIDAQSLQKIRRCIDRMELARERRGRRSRTNQ